MKNAQNITGASITRRTRTNSNAKDDYKMYIGINWWDEKSFTDYAQEVGQEVEKAARRKVYGMDIVNRCLNVCRRMQRLGTPPQAAARLIMRSVASAIIENRKAPQENTTCRRKARSERGNLLDMVA